jgi:hypothetical protein
MDQGGTSVLQLHTERGDHTVELRQHLEGQTTYKKSEGRIWGSSS